MGHSQRKEDSSPALSALKHCAHLSHLLHGARRQPECAQSHLHSNGRTALFVESGQPLSTTGLVFFFYLLVSVQENSSSRFVLFILLLSPLGELGAAEPGPTASGCQLTELPAKRSEQVCGGQ